MKFRILHNNLFLSLLFILVMSASWAQSGGSDPYTTFMSLEGAEERFNYFFNEEVKYGDEGITAYIWRDKIEDIISRINVQDDPLSKPYYETMLCQVYYDLGDFEKGSLLAKSMLAEDADLDVKVQRVLLKVADRIYSELKLFEEQIKVRKAQKSLGEDIELYTVYEKMGLYRRALEDYEMTNPYEEVSEKGNFALAKYYKERGDLMMKDGGLPRTALKEYGRGLTLIEEYINMKLSSQQDLREAIFLKGQIFGGIGKTKVTLNEFREAIPYLENGVASGKIYEKGKYPYYTMDYWTDLAYCYLKEERYDIARSYLDSVSAIGKLSPSNMIRFYHLKADYYLGTEQPLEALTYLDLYSKGRDSLERNVMAKQMLGQTVAFDLGNKAKNKLEKQESDLQLSRTEINERDKIIYLSVVALMFSLLCVVALIVAYMKSVKNKRLIESQKQIIEDSLVEKDSLLKEIHHRVKNNLQMVSSLLSLQSKNTRSRAAINALEEGQSRVKAMALIHQKLYQNDDLATIEMQEYIESLVASIHSIFKKEGYQTNIHINAEKTKLDVDRAIPIGLILNELVSNSFKYAFAENKEGNIYISLENKGKEYAFEYKDDGKGLPADYEQTSVGSMGLRLIKRLANQLRSNLQIDTHTTGARFWFNFG